MKRISRDWWRFAAAFAVAAAVVAIWVVAARSIGLNVQDVSARLMPFREAWYALPLVAIAYIILGLALVPVLLLVAATGLAFGPWLGPVYAMAGCLASASTGFGIGRWAGPERVQRLGGPRAVRVSRALARNGTLAVFALRKVPAPFMLANIVAGASSVRYRDFVAGTVLGMGAFVVALAGFGYQVTHAIEHPSIASIAAIALLFGIPLTSAWLINRRLRRRRHA